MRSGVAELEEDLSGRFDQGLFFRQEAHLRSEKSDGGTLRAFEEFVECDIAVR